MNALTRAGVVLGIGLGGFFDGIVLHQILGWHHLVCVTEHCQPQSIAQLKLQNTQDDFFHLAVWMITFGGVGLLVNAAKRAAAVSGRAVGGAMLAGWGAFNLVEGIIDHQILGIHHVLPGHPQQFLFDMLFLASGGIFLVIGGLVGQIGKACLMAGSGGAALSSPFAETNICMNANDESFSDDDVAAVAKQMWEEEGRREGKAEEHWKRAQEHLAGHGPTGEVARPPDEEAGIHG